MEILAVLLFMLVLIVLLPIALVAGGIQKIQQRKTAPQVEEAIRALIIEHVRALAIKKQQLIYVDAYGVRNTRRWDKEKEYFL